MACPFFYPVARRDNTSFIIPPRLPLGAFYDGECRASGVAFTPELTVLEEFCSHGYSRQTCKHFPPDAQIDAVRFHVTEPEPDTIQVQFIFEKDCWPASHGLLRYSEANRAFAIRHESGILQRQAEAFIESYLARR